jgi:hypothetical protein
MPLDDATLAITPEQFTGLRPDSQAALTAQLVKVGYSPEQIAKATGGTPPARPAPAGDPLSVQQKQQPSQSPVKASTYLDNAANSLSFEQKAAMAENLRKHWTGDPAKLEAALKGVADAPEPAAPVDHYALNYGDTARTLDADGLAALDTLFQNGLRSASIPRSHAQPIVSAMLESQSRYDGMSEADAKVEYANQGVILRRLAGDNLDQFMAAATSALTRMGDDVHRTLVENRALHTAEAWIALHNAGMLLTRGTKK